MKYITMVLRKKSYFWQTLMMNTGVILYNILLSVSSTLRIEMK